MDTSHSAPHERPLPLSKRLEQIIEETGPDRLPFTELAAQLHGRAWGGLLFIFAAINVLPLPPGTSAFFALPILLVAGQMVFGRASPWFPGRLDRRGVTKSELQRLISKIGWLEARVDRLFRPRMPRLTGPTAARVIGAICFVLGLIAGIPIPLLHIAPAGAVVLFGLALIYRDGALVVVAGIAAVLSLLISGIIIGSGVVVLSYIASLLHH